MTNTLKLKAAIVESGLKREEVAKEIGISKYSLHKKIHNVTEFKASEIDTLVRLLKIEDVKSIFFAKNVDCESTKRGCS